MKKLFVITAVTVSALTLFGISNAYALTGADPVGDQGGTVSEDVYGGSHGQFLTLGAQPIQPTNVGSQIQNNVSHNSHSSDRHATNSGSQTSTSETIKKVPPIRANVVVFKIGDNTYSINGTTKNDVASYIKNGRTLMPLRYVAYAVGIGDNSIYWDAQTKTAYLEKKDGNKRCDHKRESRRYENERERYEEFGK